MIFGYPNAIPIVANHIWKHQPLGFHLISLMDIMRSWGKNATTWRGDHEETQDDNVFCDEIMGKGAKWDHACDPMVCSLSPLWLYPLHLIPHIFVWGSCFWFCIPSASSRSRRLLTHNLLTHTTYLQTQLTHTQLAHTHNLHTHNLLTHNLHTHNILTLTHTTCTHTTYSHTTYSHTTCTHTTYSHTTCRRGTWRQVAALCVAGVALWDIHLRFTWQAWHVWHWAGSGGALGSHMSPWTPRLFAWQARHLATCSYTLRGRRGTLRHPPSFHMAGVALWDIHLRFTWQAWHVWHWAGSGGALGSHMSPWTPRLFAWQAWHFETWQAWHFETSTFVSRGRRGTFGILATRYWSSRVFTFFATLGFLQRLTCAGVTTVPESFRCIASSDACCYVSHVTKGATLLHLPPSLGRSTTLRCRDLC